MGANQSGRSATNVETINLRGFGPNRTLFLINGKRVANYPRVYNGNDNVFNLASIPITIVENIEIITSATSSIYGSDAIGGVVNIITKKHIDNTSLNINGSISEQGDASNTRLSLATGNSHNKTHWSFALEYENQDLLTGKQRSWLNDRFDTPANIEDQSEFRTQLPRALAVFMLEDDWTTLDPGPNVCSQYQELVYSEISFLGHYCGRDDTGDGSFINGKENISVYFSGEHSLSQDHTLMFDTLYWQSAAVRRGSHSWSSDHLKDEIQNSGNWLGDGQFIVEDGTSYSLLRDFQREELLNGKGQEEHFDEKTLTTSVQLQGTLSKNYDYAVYLSHSMARNEQTSYQIKKEAASDYYVDYNEATGTLNVDFEKWWQPLSEQGFQTIFGLDHAYSDSSVSTLGASLTGEFNTEFGIPIEFAAFTEFETSQYDLNEHPRTLGQEGQGWIEKTGTGGHGERRRYAVGGEIRALLLDNLAVDLAARYDRYTDDTLVNIAPTYKLGVEWRPVTQLLMRATYGTTFRSPDLHHVFKQVSGNEGYVADFALIDSCNAFEQGNYGEILIGGDNLEMLAKTCDKEYDFTGFYSALNESVGNKQLKPETGYTATLGFVWSPYDEVSFTFDLYNIQLNNMVVPDNLYAINLNEYECLSGQRDLSEPTCVATLDKIDRNEELGYDSFKINTIHTSFINAAMRETTGFDISANVLFHLNSALKFTLDSSYSHVLETKVQTYHDEAVNKDYRDNYYNNALRSKINTVLTLETEKWQTALTHIRYGSVPNDVDYGDWQQLERKRYTPLNLYNLNMAYQLEHQQSIRAGIVNLFDSRARSDASEQWYPYFDTSVYPIHSVVIGRQFTLGYQVSF